MYHIHHHPFLFYYSCTLWFDQFRIDVATAVLWDFSRGHANFVIIIIIVIIVGKFEDETQGIPICEFIELRSRMYSIKLDDDSEKKTAKGIVRNVIKNHLKHDNYKHILETGGRMNSSMKNDTQFRP